jgi:alpha(1,3/1,4) fucosyltransferase
MSAGKIRLDFCDFWPGFVKTDNYFYHLLKSRFEVELADNPDFVFYADPNQHVHRLLNSVRIYIGLELWPVDWSDCDYALTTHYLDDPRHLRLPFYVPWGLGPEALVKGSEDPARALAEKTGFCSFVVGKNHPRKNRKRLEIFQRLSKYKKVDSGGRFMNNIGGVIPPTQADKVEFLRKYKFHLALENQSVEGYTSEKICDAVVARSLPVYWGNPLIAR